MFIRVRSAVVGGPLHEFDIPMVTFNRHPDRYKVIDKKPVARQRPASHVSGVVEADTPAQKRATPARKRATPKRAPKTGEDKIAPSAGLAPEEEN